MPDRDLIEKGMLYALQARSYLVRAEVFVDDDGRFSPGQVDPADLYRFASELMIKPGRDGPLAGLFIWPEKDPVPSDDPHDF